MHASFLDDTLDAVDGVDGVEERLVEQRERLVGREDGLESYAAKGKTKRGDDKAKHGHEFSLM